MWKNTIIALGFVILIRNILILINQRNLLRSLSANENYLAEYSQAASDSSAVNPDENPDSHDYDKISTVDISSNKTKIFYSKIPNTGGTTLQNLLSIYGYNNDLQGFVSK